MLNVLASPALSLAPSASAPSPPASAPLCAVAAPPPPPVGSPPLDWLSSMALISSARFM
jgi:hypothetical protein